MKSLLSFILAALLAAMVFLTGTANPVLAGQPESFSQQQLQEDLVKYKYPYSEVPQGERIYLAQYQIKALNEQSTHFRPDQGTTSSYIQNAVTQMQKLLPSYSQENVNPAGITGYLSGTASTPVSINMIYYGTNNGGADQAIVNAHPAFLVNNSPAGPWKGDANVNMYMSAGIKYFEYLSGGYENRTKRSIPTDLQSNLKYITAAARAGAYGIFLDEVSDGIWTPANYSYLQQIYTRAHILGLKVVFNTGVSLWADQLMKYCDYMGSNETWQPGPLTTSQRTWATRTWLITYDVDNATNAVNLTEAAWNQGIKSHYSTATFSDLPEFFSSYVSQIRSYMAYTLTTGTVGSGTITRNLDQITYTGGTSVQLTANPAAGWGFSGWSGDISGSANPATINMSANKKVTATFTRNPVQQFTLTINTNGSGTATRAPDQATYTSGVSVQVTATPTSGWSFSGWSGDLNGSTNPANISMNSNKTITAAFTQNPVQQFTLTLNTSGSGTVTKVPNQVSYDSGDSVQITAIPTSGWGFSGWSGDLSGSANPATINMSSNKTIMATFTQIPVQFTLTLNTSGSGTATRAPDQATYNSGVSVQVTATPTSGWSFNGWSGDLNGITNPASINMSSDKTITAAFTQNPVQQFTLTLNTSGSGTVTKVPNQVSYDSGDSVQITAIPTSGWSFNGWSGDLSGSTNPANINMSSNKTITATFKQNTSITLASSTNPAVLGQSLTFTAMTSSGSGPGTPTGTVRFMDGGTSLGTAALDASATAVYSTSSLPVGTHSITAVYNGDSVFNPASSSTLSQVVNKATTSTNINSSVNPSTSGKAVTFTATVSVAAPGAGKATGTITFKNGTATLGVATINTSGSATYTTRSLGRGTYSITAVYSGSTYLNASTSPVLTQQVNR